MKIPKEIAERVLNGSEKDLYHTFIMLDGEYDAYIEDYAKVRNGILIKFDIYDLWESERKIQVKEKINKVIIQGMEYNMDDYRSEREERRFIMAKAILENVEEVSNITPR